MSLLFVVIISIVNYGTEQFEHLKLAPPLDVFQWSL